MTEKRYTFRTDNEELQSFLDAQKEVSSFVRQLLSDFLKGRLVYADSRREKLKDQKLDLEIKAGYLKMWREIKELNKDLQMRISPSDLIAIMNGEMPKSMVLLNPHKNDELSPYDELNKRLQCVDCLRIIECGIPDATINDKVNKYIDHVKHEHNRTLNELEKKVLGELMGVDKWE